MLKKLYLLIFLGCIFGCSESDPYTTVTGNEHKSIEAVPLQVDFRVGDIIGVYPVGYVNNQPGIPGDIAYPVNVPFVYDGSRWKPQDEDYLFTDEEVLDIYAYYPYDAELGSILGKTDISRYPVDLSGRQADRNNDLLWSKTTLNTGISNMVNLDFSHAFSKITLILSINDLQSEPVEVSIHNLYTSSVVNLTNGTITNNNNIREIIYPVTTDNELTFEAIVLPQLIEANTPLFLISFGENKVVYTTDTSLNLQQGRNYTFNLTVDITN